MTDFSSVLFRVLRLMDEEARPNTKGQATGLNWYGGFREPSKRRPRTEVCWSQRLHELLPQNGFPTRLEVPYPNLRRCKCDNVVTLQDGSTLWLENKGAWKDYWTQKRNLTTYRSYLLHPLVSGLDASKSHTVPLDLKKLASLSSPPADHVGLLLIGFEQHGQGMEKDIEELERLAGLGQSPWKSAKESWEDSHRPGGHVRCWYWQRQVARTHGGCPT